MQTRNLICWVSLIGLIALGMACSATFEALPTEVPADEETTAHVSDANSKPEDRGDPDSFAPKSELRIAATTCGIPDPAIDAWDTGGGLATPPLVPEIHAGLARYSSDPDNPVTLDLAESYSSNTDATVHSFKLRPNIRFSDGSPIVAVDVVKSWSRALHRSTGFGRANLHLGAIVGADAIVDGADVQLTGAIAIDDRTLEVRLTNPSPNFIVSVADPVAFVVQVGLGKLWENQWSNFGDSDYGPSVARLSGEALPSGAGPFMLAHFETSTDAEWCILEANPHYWDEPASVDIIRISDPRFEFGDDEDDLRHRYEAAVENGRFHYTLVGQDDQALGTVDESSVGALRHAVITQVDVVGLLFDPSVPPFDDPAVRRALIASYDASDYLRGPTYRSPDRVLPDAESGTAPAVNLPEWWTNDATNTHRVLSRYVGVDARAAARQRNFYTLIASGLFDQWRDAYGWEAHMSYGRGITPLGIHVVSETVSPDRAETMHRIVRSYDVSHSPLAADIERAAQRNIAATDPVQRATMAATLEQTILDEALFLPMFWTTGTATVLAHPSIRGLTGARYPHSQFYTVWFEDAP